MITSKLTNKAQTTIPRAVRHHLGLEQGDLLGYSIEGDSVVLRNPLGSKPAGQAPTPTDPIFREWESEADQRAYDGL
jgi:bifunctional DNA-binding transcriptional regulator/antitoxin component of YhaV-PrlF toxin-antitoxin module